MHTSGYLIQRPLEATRSPNISTRRAIDCPSTHRRSSAKAAKQSLDMSALPAPVHLDGYGALVNRSWLWAPVDRRGAMQVGFKRRGAPPECAMRCMACRTEMTLTNVVQDDTMGVPGFEHSSAVRGLDAAIACGNPRFPTAASPPGAGRV
jgi:hypothetical protein